MKRRIRCRLGIHNPVQTNNEVKLWRWNNHYFDIVEECKDCGKMVVIGSVEMPPPTYMATWNYKVLND